MKMTYNIIVAGCVGILALFAAAFLAPQLASAQSCSISFSPSSISPGQSATIYGNYYDLPWYYNLVWGEDNNRNTLWYAQDAGAGVSNFTMSNTVSPSQTTTYTGYWQKGYYNEYGNPQITSSGSCSGTLTVNANCSLPWGGYISHGQSVTAYYQSSVPYGSSCSSETRSCNNGSLSGSYQYQSCSVQDPPLPTCSTSVNPSAINQGNSSTLSWSSSNATSVYIANVGWVNPSGSTTVAPSSSTNYACYASGPGGTSDWMSTGTTLTVYASCSLPWGGTIQNGQSTTAYESSTVPYGSSCTSQTRSCSNGTLSGSYQYQSCSVNDPANCTLDGVTVNHGDSRTFYNTETAPQGETCTSDGHSQSRTCDNGTLSGSSSYQYANCQCTASTVYTCSPQNNVVRTETNTACNVTVTNPYQTCTSPAFCSPGVSQCLYPSPDFGTNGHLRASPSLVIPANPVTLFWNVTNVSSCTVSGTNGDSFSSTSSGSNGQESSLLFEQTTFTLTCIPLDPEAASINESVTVNLVPVFQEF